MKQFMILVIVLCFGTVSIAGISSDEAEEVKAAFLDYIAAINAGDADAAAKHYHPDYSVFMGNGGLLIEKFGKDRLWSLFDTGLKLDIQVRQTKVIFYDNTAVVAAYVVGEGTLPDGTTLGGNWRISQVWIKKGSQWKAAHWHSSPLTVELPD